jgi:cell division protein FtsB
VSDTDFIAYENHRLTIANAELRKERDELEQHIKRLEEAGDKMEAWLRDERLDAVQHTVSKWLKAKEAKP